MTFNAEQFMKENQQKFDLLIKTAKQKAISLITICEDYDIDIHYAHSKNNKYHDDCFLELLHSSAYKAYCEIILALHGDNDFNKDKAKEYFIYAYCLAFDRENYEKKSQPVFNQNNFIDFMNEQFNQEIKNV